MADNNKNRAKELMKEIEQIDTQIIKQQAVLKENNIGMDEPLTDDKDFPIEGIDHYAVREARGKIRSLQNDRKARMTEMEQILALIHEMNAGKAEQENNGNSGETVHRTSNDPFVQVDKVMPNSPAEEAGLNDGDLVVQFGSLHADVFKNLNQLKDLVTTSHNKPIRLTVLRNVRVHHFNLTPKTWNGNGLLGCSFTVVEKDKLR